MFDRFKTRKKTTEEKPEEKQRLSKKQLQEKERYVREVMSKDRLPIIILDKQWHDVKALVGDDTLAKKEAELLEVLKERGALTNKLKADNKLKQSLMDKVLMTSQKIAESNTEDALQEMEKLHQAILKLNEELQATESRLEELEPMIQDINRQILEEAVATGYEQMALCKQKADVLDAEIDSLRQQVLEKTAAKKQNDTELNVLYHYLHNIVGYKQIDKVDKVLGD